MYSGGMHLSFSKLLMLIAVLFIAYLALNRATVTFGMCPCMNKSAAPAKENMIGPVPSCGEMCARLEADNYGSNDFTTVV